MARAELATTVKASAVFGGVTVHSTWTLEVASDPVLKRVILGATESLAISQRGVLYDRGDRAFSAAPLKGVVKASGAMVTWV